MKGLAVVLFLLTAASARAEWTWISQTKDESADVYVDAATIRKRGNMVKMWSLYDLKAARQAFAGKLYLSSVGQNEYDCDEERTRSLYVSLYSSNMGAGESVLTRSDPDKWKPVFPGSVLETLWKIACGQ